MLLHTMCLLRKRLLDSVQYNSSEWAQITHRTHHFIANMEQYGVKRSMNITLKLGMTFGKILWVSRETWNKEIHLPERTLFKLISEIFNGFNCIHNIKMKVTLRKTLNVLKDSCHSEKECICFWFLRRHFIYKDPFILFIYMGIFVIRKARTRIHKCICNEYKQPCMRIVKISIFVILNVI